MWNNQPGDIDWGPTSGGEKVLGWKKVQRGQIKWPQWSHWVSFWTLIWGQGGGAVAWSTVFPKNIIGILDRLNRHINRTCWQGWNSLAWVHDIYIQIRGMLSLLGVHTTCGRRRGRINRRSKSGARCLLVGYDEMGKEVSSLILSKLVGKKIVEGKFIYCI